MGSSSFVTNEKFPIQGSFLNKRTRVRLEYNDKILMGTIIRDDISPPFLTIIKLDDERVILGTECVYSPDT